MKYNHVEFSNSTTKRLKQCQTPLGKKITLNKSISIMPELVYPLSLSLSQLQVFDNNFLVCFFNQNSKNHYGIELIVQVLLMSYRIFMMVKYSKTLKSHLSKNQIIFFDRIKLTHILD